jgi:hypothetical protein
MFENARQAAQIEAERYALIAQARAAGFTLQAIADAYGTNRLTVLRWANRVSWPVPPTS